MIDWTKVIITADDDTVSEASGQVILLASGVPGESASVEVAETVTLDPLEDADVENVGDSRNVRLKFKIPRGQSGVWGGIGGTLEDQADLKQALDAKADIIHTSASGSLVHITDGAAYPVDSLTVDIDPVQDLHGYDSPWPAGGGKNLVEATGEWNISGSGVVTQETNYTGIIARIIQGTTYTISKSGTKITPQCMGYYTSYPEVGATSYNGERIIPIDGTFTAPIDGYILARVATTQQTGYQIEVGSSATSFAPYSNVCPISGHSTATVTRTGKNLWTSGKYTKTYTDLTFTPVDNEIKVNGTATATRNYYFVAESVVVSNAYVLLPGRTYTYSWSLISGTTSNLAGGYGFFYWKKSDMSTRLNDQIGLVSSNKTFTLSEDSYILPFFYVTSGSVLNDAVFGFQLEQGSSATTYEPYGTSVTIALGNTYYGAQLDVLTGTLTVDKISVDMSALSWNVRYTGTTNKTVSASVSSSYPLAYADQSFISESYAYKGYVTQASTLSDPDSSGVGIWSYYNASAPERVNVYVVLDKNSSPSGNLVYKIATPTVITGLTPAQISLLLGENNVWADTGDTTVGYRADTKLYIDSKLAAAIAELQALILEH